MQPNEVFPNFFLYFQALSNLCVNLNAEPVGAKAPTFSGDVKGIWLAKSSGQSFGLLCRAQGFPVPAFR